MDFETRVHAAKAEVRARSLDGIERKFVPSTVETRATDDDSWFRVVGHAAVFSVESEDLGGWVEIIDPGFFDRVLNDDVRALVNHDPNRTLARLKVSGVGGLKINQDAAGLAYDFEPTHTSYARDLRENLATGVIDQSSFAFRIGRDGARWEDDAATGQLVRRLLKGGCSQLFDVSTVAYPATISTDSALAPKRTATDQSEAHWRLADVDRRMREMQAMGLAPDDDRRF